MPKKENKKPLFHEDVIKRRDQGDANETWMHLYKDDNKRFTMNEVNSFAKSFDKKVKDTKSDMRYMIKVLGVDGVFTLKALDGPYKELLEEDDYYVGRVKDKGKFTNEFLQIQLYVYESKPAVKKDYFPVKVKKQ